jgi:glycosyltransferase involved in cell wall biosynthesis
LHWVQGETLSIAEIGRLRKPVVWTLHDMWSFCGAEHLAQDSRWRDGYRKNNRPGHEHGIDLNRWTWNRKRRHWKQPMHIIAPSRWMASCVRESALMRGWPVTVIPNPIDTGRWQPLQQTLARRLLGLPTLAPLLLFGTFGANAAPHKGFDLLQAALERLRAEVPEFQLVVFGQHRPKDPPDLGFPVHYMGYLHDDLSLQALYCAADILVLPSRQDNLPNTGIESLACGTPVVAFNASGLPDIVDHRETGYLARAFDPDDLARGVIWVLENTKALGLRDKARAVAVERFSYPAVAEKYQVVYDACRA